MHNYATVNYNGRLPCMFIELYWYTQGVQLVNKRN